MSARPEDRLDEIRRRFSLGIAGTGVIGHSALLSDTSWLIAEVERLRAISGAAPPEEPDLDSPPLCPLCDNPGLGPGQPVRQWALCAEHRSVEPNENPTDAQRLEWVATALHGDPIFGPGAFDPLVRQVNERRAIAGAAPPRNGYYDQPCPQCGVKLSGEGPPSVNIRNGKPLSYCWECGTEQHPIAGAGRAAVPDEPPDPTLVDSRGRGPAVMCPDGVARLAEHYCAKHQTEIENICPDCWAEADTAIAAGEPPEPPGAEPTSKALMAAQQVLAPDRIGFDVHIHLTTKLVEDALRAAYRVDFARLAEENRTLREALRKYGTHLRGCGFPDCDCGLDALAGVPQEKAP